MSLFGLPFLLAEHFFLVQLQPLFRNKKKIFVCHWIRNKCCFVYICHFIALILTFLWNLASASTNCALLIHQFSTSIASAIKLNQDIFSKKYYKLQYLNWKIISKNDLVQVVHCIWNWMFELRIISMHYQRHLHVLRTKFSLYFTI